MAAVLLPVEAVLSVDAVLSVVALVATVGATGCVGEREFPKPAQMCENLVEACGVPVLLQYEDDFFRGCYDTGLAGQKDRTKEAQCFAAYDECISNCEVYGYYWTLDSGTDSGVDAATLDAASDQSDAQTTRDE